MFGSMKFLFVAAILFSAGSAYGASLWQVSESFTIANTKGFYVDGNEAALEEEMWFPDNEMRLPEESLSPSEEPIVIPEGDSIILEGFEDPQTGGALVLDEEDPFEDVVIDDEEFEGFDEE